MKAEYLPLSDTGFVSRMVLDYIEGNKELEAFHNGIPSFENLNSQALQKKLLTILILEKHFAMYWQSNIRRLIALPR